MSFYVLPQQDTRGDERSIRLANAVFILASYSPELPSVSSLERPRGGRLAVVCGLLLILVGCCGMRWGVGYGFLRPGPGTGPCLCRKEGVELGNL